MTTPLNDKLVEIDARRQAGQTPVTGPTLADLVKQSEPQFRRALPGHVDAGRFVRMSLTALRTVPRLLECSPESVLAGLMTAAQLGVEIDAVRGQAYLVPRYNGRTKTMEATFQLGYRGLIDLAGRGGITVEAHEVRDGDAFAFTYGLEPTLTHTPNLGTDRGDVFAYYAVARFSDGRLPMFLVLSALDVEEVRAKFAPKDKSGKVTGPWADHLDAMAKKTAIRRLLSYLPLPVELSDAVAADSEPIVSANAPAFTAPPAASLSDPDVEDAVVVPQDVDQDTGEVDAQ
jgi:recombination protein RecT